MSRLRYSPISFLAAFCLLSLLLAGSVLVANEPPASKPRELTPAAARKAINERYEAWGRARVGFDKMAMDSMLAPDFYVQLYGRRISRDKFLSDISEQRPGSRLTRFDTAILTLQRTEEGWTVVITEKLELEVVGSDGKPAKVCSFWVTRDGWRQAGEKWLVTFSEAIGHENWAPGTTPPIKDW